MTWAKDLTIEHYYVPPGHSKAYKLIHKSYFKFKDQDECSSPTSSGPKDIFLIFKNPESTENITMTVSEDKHLGSECFGCVVQGGKKTRRKMKKRKPRKSRKARKSARG